MDSLTQRLLDSLMDRQVVRLMLSVLEISHAAVKQGGNDQVRKKWRVVKLCRPFLRGYVYLTDKRKEKKTKKDKQGESQVGLNSFPKL